MASPSKEDRVTELFLDNPTKHWHFEEIMRISGVSRGKTGKWLSRLTKEGIITRTKKQGEMPYYTGNHETPRYRNKKKLYAQTKLYESGLLDHLAGLKKAKTVIIFGSFTRSDWHEDSDIDLFIYGDDEGIDTIRYSRELRRELHVFTAHDIYHLKRLGKDLIGNIIKGNIVKGGLEFITVDIPDAKTQNKRRSL